MQQLRPGEPCGHPGCLSHISHPCEGCGRVGGRLIVFDDPVSDPLTEKQLQQMTEWYKILEERLGVSFSKQTPRTEEDFYERIIKPHKPIP